MYRIADELSLLAGKRKWCHRRPFPADARFLRCDTASIIPSEVWEDKDHQIIGEPYTLLNVLQDARPQDVLLGTLARFCRVDRTTLVEKAEGPQNTLFLCVSVAFGFQELRSVVLHHKPHCYEIKTYGPPEGQGCWHTTSHFTFVDHSTNTSRTLGGGRVNLPDRELLQRGPRRVHAAPGPLDLSLRTPGVPSSAYPEPSGSAFWRSVVEYEGVDLETERAQLGRGGSACAEGYSES
ncbi:hypothetical protein V8D89_006668 [Ganoderma adspersum]